MANKSKSELESIQEGRLFVGSGVEGIVNEKITTVLDELGQYVVDYRDAGTEIDKIVYNSNASQNEDDIAKSIFSDINNIHYDSKIGYYIDMYVGYVSDSDFRKKGSSGGMVSWTAATLIEGGYIDGFIHVKKQTEHNGEEIFTYAISRTVDEIRSGSKSRYYPVELSSVLKEVKSFPGKYAVVGIPEIITELRLLSEQDEVINKRIKYYFGLVAGHQKTTKYADAIAWEYGIKPGDLEDIDFRVKREVGSAIQYDMQVTGKINGVKRTVTMPSNEPFVSSWAHGFFKARFSDFTDNTFNEVADITFGDAWLDEYVGDPKGNNIVIIRNKELAKIFHRGIKNKTLKLDSVDKETIIRSQSGLLRHTRDELPYRLYREKIKSGWAPIKRLAPSNALNKHRKKVQDVRQNIAEKSHISYRDAVNKGDFNLFRKTMQPYVDEYNQLYGVKTSSPKGQKIKVDGAILTLTGYFNYGNIIQRYALQEFLRKHGHNFISYMNSHGEEQSIYNVSTTDKIKTPLRTVKRFMLQLKPYWYIPTISDIYPDMKKNANLIEFVNNNIRVRQFHGQDECKTYIVGSDQVWRNWWEDRSVLGYYFLDFTRGSDVRRISYGASFGKDTLDGVMSREDIGYVKPYLEQFNAVSVREKSGKETIENNWEVDKVEHVVDPTMLLDAATYSSLIDKSDVANLNINPLFTYMLDETQEIRTFIERIKDHTQEEVTRICTQSDAGNDVLPPVELWLKGFRDAKLVVTNSFHGMMFSVINRTSFYVIGKESGGLARVREFLAEFGLEDRFIGESDLESFDLGAVSDIEWSKIDTRLNRRIQESGDWLLSSIN